MLFSVNYQSKNKAKADEIRCPYNQLGMLYGFMKDNRDKRYLIAGASSEDPGRLLEQADIVRDSVTSYTIECNSILYTKKLIKDGYNAFVKFPVADWETLHSFISMGVSDIYVDSCLGFQLGKVASLCADKGIRIRVSPSLSPTAAITGLKPNSFFIRPEDLSLFDKYIDIIDFKVTNQEKEDALFSIYKRGNFIYNLKDLLDDCTFSVPNPYLKPEFGQARVNCGQRCLIPGHSCHLCETQVQLTNLVYDYFKDEERDKENDLQ